MVLRSLKRRIKRFSKTRTEVLFVIVCAVTLVSFLGIKTVRHRVPEGVKNPSLVLQAMEKANCVGDVWGLDIYLGRKNQELLSQPFSKEKRLIVGLFTEEVLKNAPWERPLDDLKYAFYILREEKVRSLSEATVILIRAKEWWRDFWIKEAPLSPRDSLVLKTLREEEKALPPAEMGKRYQEKVWKTENEEMKARLLARETYLDQENLQPRFKRRLEQLRGYEREGLLPFSVVLAIREMAKGPLLQRDLLVPGQNRFSSSEREVTLKEYQKTLTALSSGDAKGFVEKAEALANQYAKKDFAPVLLYQAWGVAKYDLQDPVRAAELLAKLKKEYPVSDWAYPEKAPDPLARGAGFCLKKTGGLGKFLLPFNLLRGPAKKVMAEFLEKMKKINGELAPGATREIILDEEALQSGFLDFFSPSEQKALRGYQANLCEQGVRVFWGWDFGFFNVVFSARGSLEAKGVRDQEEIVLKLREIRVQGVAIPRSFLRQSENDFKEILEKAELPLELSEAKYWKGGAKFVFKKKEDFGMSGSDAETFLKDQAAEDAPHA
jgi:hypothetical protein